MQNDLPVQLVAAGITIQHEFVPGDLGRLIQIHGLQNARDYGFNPIHEAYCARIAADFLIDGGGGRSCFWLAKRGNDVAGSVLIIEVPNHRAQLRILFVDDAVRGLGLGRWLVEDSVRFCRSAGFSSVFLWTVEGLQRAQSIYQSLGFEVVETKTNQQWGGTSVEVRYELKLG